MPGPRTGVLTMYVYTNGLTLEIQNVTVCISMMLLPQNCPSWKM